ncbi:hypothetical protein GLE_3008 [Lysobacter enzymogenes]|uniref:Uncharacterized protein n=1 Tax=Lysobacter enzymogenes TaxID=69 RepID=A0A0S2DIM0_LYSEN|nr:hypothetical protein GLE_3008 [Lysobacter enzymogenes]
MRSVRRRLRGAYCAAPGQGSGYAASPRAARRRTHAASARRRY